jgi:hypothetical protein
MKTATQGILGAVILVLVAANPAPAVVDQALQIQGTNLVLSWPSPGGYQQYLIQYRQTLDATTPWTELTNAYPANSTNRTTYTIYGVVPPPPSGGGGGGTKLGAPPEPMSAIRAEPTEPMAAPANGSGSIVPLAIYPPGFDLSNFLIYDPGVADWVSGATYVRPAPAAALLSRPLPQDGPDPDSPPSSGFFRVFHIPDWSFNLTNYTYDGPTFFPVDFADYIDRVVNVEVLLNGQPISDAIFMPYVFGNGETNWGMGIYFDLFPSGTYQIQLRTTLRLNDLVGDEAVELVLSNLARPIVLDNQVTFTNWDGLIMSTNFTYQAQTKNHNTDWWIDIYDAWDGYVNGGSGHTSNGQIQWTWDLTDTYGNERDDLDSDPYFYSEITFATSSGQYATRAAPSPQIEYPAVGRWLLSYLDHFYTDAGPRHSGGDQYYQIGLGAMAEWIDYRSVPWSYFPLKFGTNSYTQEQRNGSWINLKATLFIPQYRNLYYFGHGGPDMIGDDMHVFDTNNYVIGGTTFPGSKAYLTSQTVSNELTFNRHGGARPYRFVWLDGCSTANGNWPGAFGVDKAIYDLNHYTNSAANPKHRRPSAFVGWNQTVGGQGWGDVQGKWLFNGMVFQEWSYWWQTEGLEEAFEDAVGDVYWPPGGQSQLWGALCIYGYTNMLFNQFNQKQDWRWP